MTSKLSMNPSKMAVIIMDYQNGQLGFFSEDFRTGLITRANEVLVTARRFTIPVIYVEMHREDDASENKVHDALSRDIKDIVLTKHRGGAFSTTNLDEILKQQGVDTLVIMGIVTSGCVLSTMRWAADLDYKLVILSDCCADRDEEVHRILIEKVFPRQASVITSQEFEHRLKL